MIAKEQGGTGGAGLAVLGEDALTTEEVARQCRASRAAVVDWIVKGVEVGGRRVYLGAIRLGQRYRIAPGQLAEFVRACNPGRPVEMAAEQAARKEASRASSRALDRELGPPGPRKAPKK